MKRGIMALLVTAAVLALSITAGASETGCSVEVKLDAGELPVTNGAVTLYRVGIPTDGGYRLLDRYGGGVVRSEDISSGNLARWLSELADSGREQLLDVEGRVVFSQGGPICHQHNTPAYHIANPVLSFILSLLSLIVAFPLSLFFLPLKIVIVFPDSHIIICIIAITVEI